MILNPKYFVGKNPTGNLVRGRDYGDPIGDMVRAIPPGTPLTPTAITAELYDTRLWSLALINASMNDVLARINRNCVHSARASGGK